jgi:hypothetical protein
VVHWVDVVSIPLLHHIHGGSELTPQHCKLTKVGKSTMYSSRKSHSQKLLIAHLVFRIPPSHRLCVSWPPRKRHTTARRTNPSYQTSTYTLRISTGAYHKPLFPPSLHQQYTLSSFHHCQITTHSPSCPHRAVYRHQRRMRCQMTNARLKYTCPPCRSRSRYSMAPRMASCRSRTSSLEIQTIR